MEKLAERLVCPISKALPLDPVVAQDGFTYDSQFILEHLKTHGKSPVTELPIENVLVPSNNVLGLLHFLRDSGVTHPLVQARALR